MKQKKKGKGNGNIRNWGNNQGSGLQTAEKNKKNKVTIAELKTDIASLKEILTENYKNMESLKTHTDSLNSKVNGGDKNSPFNNITNSDLKRPTWRHN